MQAAPFPPVFPSPLVPSKPAVLITGEALFSALANLTTTVKWVREGTPTSRIPPNAALCIARGGIYEGKVEAGRLRLIRELVPPRPAVRDDECWRVSQAAVLPISLEWLRSVGHDVLTIPITRYNAAASPLPEQALRGASR